MENIIYIEQRLIKTSDSACTIKMTVEQAGEIEAIELNYSNTNFIFPLYNSLLKVIRERELEDVHIDLDTSDKRFASEIAGNPNKNARMLEILKNIQEHKNITINAQ